MLTNDMLDFIRFTIGADSIDDNAVDFTDHDHGFIVNGELAFTINNENQLTISEMNIEDYSVSFSRSDLDNLINRLIQIKDLLDN